MEGWRTVLWLSDRTVLFPVSLALWMEIRVMERRAGGHPLQLGLLSCNSVCSVFIFYNCLLSLRSEHGIFLKLLGAVNFVLWKCLFRCCSKFFYDRFLNGVLKNVNFLPSFPSPSSPPFLPLFPSLPPSLLPSPHLLSTY